MAFSNTTSLAIAELVIYVLLLPLLFFSAYCHKLPGLLGHFYLFAFIVLRLTTDGMTIASRNESDGISATAAAINSVGLTPLLLAVVSILAEVRYYVLRNDWNKAQHMKNILIDLIMHALVLAGTILPVIGISNLTEAATQADVDHYRSLSKAGSIILLTSWLFASFWTIRNARLCHRTQTRGSAYKLVIAIICSLPFLAARVIYTVVYCFDDSLKLVPALAPFAIKLVLIFLVQLIAAGFLLAGLFLSRDLIAIRGVPSSSTGETTQIHAGCKGQRIDVV